MFNEGILVLLAQEGEPHARVVLLAKNRSFVKKTAAGICGRPLRWGSDKELEVALNAFDLAIDKFSNSVCDSFKNFSQQVIYIKIYDFYARDDRERILSNNIQVDSKVASLFCEDVAENKSEKIRELWERYEDVLAGYGVSYVDLIDDQVKPTENGGVLSVLIKSARSYLRKYWDEISKDGA